MLQALAEKMANLAVRAVARLRALGKPSKPREAVEVVKFATKDASPAGLALRAGGAASGLTREQLLPREQSRAFTPAVAPGPVAQLLQEVGFFAPAQKAEPPMTFAAEVAKAPPSVSTRQSGPAAQLLAERDTYTPIYVQRHEAAEF